MMSMLPWLVALFRFQATKELSTVHVSHIKYGGKSQKGEFRLKVLHICKDSLDSTLTENLPSVGFFSGFQRKEDFGKRTEENRAGIGK